MVEPHSSNFRVIITIFLGVRIFRKFTVALYIMYMYIPVLISLMFQQAAVMDLPTANLFQISVSYIQIVIA